MRDLHGAIIEAYCNNSKSLSLTRSFEATLLPEIGELSNLEEIYLPYNSFVELPKEIWLLKKLRRLTLSNGRIVSLPSEIGRLESLEYLDLTANELLALPIEIGQCKKLNGLKLSQNKIASLPEEIAELTALHNLDVQGNLLTAIPIQLGELLNLEYLDISENRIKNLPSEIGNLKRLFYLRANNNHLVQLTPAIGQLKSLWELHLNHNRLTSVPAEISLLGNLRILELKGNLLTELPLEISRLVNLEKLILRDDQVSPVPLTAIIKKWDVFISHASEDKDTVAIPLANLLKRAGLKVWIDALELRIGDSLREKIERGLAESRFGIVILSEEFLNKRWPKQELNGFMALEEDGQNVILPVWHNMTKVRLAQASPILADRLAANTESGIPAVAAEIIDAVLYRTSNSPSTLFPNITRQLVQMIGSEFPSPELKNFLFMHHGILNAALGYDGNTILPSPSDKGIERILFGRQMNSEGRLSLTCVAFSISSGSLFQENGDPIFQIAQMISDLRNFIKHDLVRVLPNNQLAWSDWDEGAMYEKTIILAGRRYELDERERSFLARLNYQLEDEAIKIRSYDWLIDACDYMFQKYHRP